MRQLPYLTADEMRKVDRAMVADARIELIQMMENAGHVLATLARDRFLEGDPAGRRVLALCGTGNNGGGGLVAARRLHGWGARVRVITTRRTEAFMGVPEHQLDIVERLGIPCTHTDEPTVLGEFDLIVDAIIGYGLDGAPRDGVARLIDLANELGAPVLSLDVPSGLDATSGRAEGDAVRPDATLTLGLPKIGLDPDRSAGAAGEVYVGDIGIPPQIYRGSGLAYDVGPIFARRPYIRV